jgi:hypothetical protein
MRFRGDGSEGAGAAQLSPGAGAVGAGYRQAGGGQRLQLRDCYGSTYGDVRMQCTLARRSKRQRVSRCDDLGCPHGVGRGGRVVVYGAW